MILLIQFPQALVPVLRSLDQVGRLEQQERRVTGIEVCPQVLTELNVDLDSLGFSQ
jgi:hypothetical protein